jgi:hypothetical protein
MPGIGRPLVVAITSIGAHAADEIDRHRRGAGHREPQACGVIAGQVGVEQRLVERGRPGEHRDPFPRDQAHHRGHVEDRAGHDRRAGEDAGEHGGLQPRAVEERVDDQVPVALAQSDGVRPGRVAAGARPVGEHGALRGPGRAGGEDDVADVVRAEARLGDFTAFPGPLEERLPSGRVPRRPGKHDDLERRLQVRVAGQHSDVVGVDEVGHGQQQPCPPRCAARAPPPSP